MQLHSIRVIFVNNGHKKVLFAPDGNKLLITSKEIQETFTYTTVVSLQKEVVH